MKPALCVWWDGRLVGALRVNVSGEMSFSYESAWLADSTAPALSASLPKQIGAFGRRACSPFFGGLLPEEAQRELVAKLLGLSKGNTLGLLTALGGDVAGALTLWPEGQTPPANFSLDAQSLAMSGTAEMRSAADKLDDSRLVALLDALPTRPFMAGTNGLRLSLAGAQSKIPVVVSNGQIALPAPGQPTTHILKPPIPRFQATTENEAFAMRLAAAMGLDVAPIDARVVAGRSFLLVQRYDRVVDADGTTCRLHQEDFCQALGVESMRKYASEGGPHFKACFDLVRRVAQRPAVDVLKLLDAAIFNLLIGNADAHGKNFSLLYGPQGAALAPLYDLLSTVAYPELSPKLAMKMGKCATLEEMDTSAWRKFASDAGLAAPFVQRRVVELADKLIGCAHQIVVPLCLQHLEEAPLLSLVATVTQRATRARASV
jgi:serine/threonine-protein kinase HipA